MDVTKVPITNETMLTESKLETVKNLIWLSTVQNNSMYGILCTYITQTLLCIRIYKYVNLNNFVNCTLPLM